MIFEKIREKIEDAKGWEDIDGKPRFTFRDKQMLEIAIGIVNQVEAEYINGWIPCSERLPDVEADVLLSLRSLDIYIGFRANTEGCFYVEGEGYVEYDNVLAWQPLPKPYTPKGE